jgi:glutathione S-transferase
MNISKDYIGRAESTIIRLREQPMPSFGGNMIKQLHCAAALMMFAMASASAAGTKVSNDSKVIAPPLDLTIYHLEGRRSERIVWLCEELGIPYKLEYKRGDLAGSMKTIHDVSPLMPVAPTVRIGGQVMVESGAIIELLLAREGHGRLEPALSSPDYPYYLQWMHFAEGSFAARVIGDYRVAMIQGKPKTPAGGYKLVDTEAVLIFMEDFLSKHPYFGGSAFSAADIMMLFPTNITEAFNVADLSAYPHIIAWRTNVEARPAYKKMLSVARPDGVPGAPKPLPKT